MLRGSALSFAFSRNLERLFWKLASNKFFERKTEKPTVFKNSFKLFVESDMNLIKTNNFAKRANFFGPNFSNGLTMREFYHFSNWTEIWPLNWAFLSGQFRVIVHLAGVSPWNAGGGRMKLVKDSFGQNDSKDRNPTLALCGLDLPVRKLTRCRSWSLTYHRNFRI